MLIITALLIIHKLDILYVVVYKDIGEDVHCVGIVLRDAISRQFGKYVWDKNIGLFKIKLTIDSFFFFF